MTVPVDGIERDRAMPMVPIMPDSPIDKEIELQPLTNNKRKDALCFHDEDGGAETLLYVDFQDESSADAQSFADRLHKWLYPPDIPRQCQLLRRENIAIPACYLLVGLLQGLYGPLINVYPLDLGATEAQQTTLSNIRSLPASFKLLFGFLSDNFPVFGYRRKSYMIVGWLLAAISMLNVLMTSNLTIDKQQVYDETTATTKIVTTAPPDAPSVPFLSLQLLLFGIGFWLADVMGDSLVAEKAKLEPPHSRGHIQSSCYSYRFFGLMCAAPFSTAIYSFWGPYYVFFLMAILPLSILPLIYMLGEIPNAPVASTADQCHEIWKTVCLFLSTCE